MAIQFNQPDIYNRAFSTGYSLMDKVYSDAKANRLKSKLSEIYTDNPDMSYSDRIKKATGLMAIYGEPLKALEIDAKLSQAEAIAEQKNRANEMVMAQTRGKVAQRIKKADGSVVALNVFGEEITPEGTNLAVSNARPIANKLTTLIINDKPMRVQVGDNGSMRILGEAPKNTSSELNLDALKSMSEPQDKGNKPSFFSNILNKPKATNSLESYQKLYK